MPNSGNDEIFTSVPTELALRQAEIGAMRTLNDSVVRLADRIDIFAADLGEIKSKVTTIEARNFDSQITKLEADTKDAINIIHSNNRTRDERLISAERQIAKFGAYVSVAACIGAAAIGAIAIKVFGQ